MRALFKSSGGCQPPRPPTGVRRRANSLIALRKGIRFDEVGLVDDLVLTICLSQSDAQLAPEMVVGVNLDVAFRSRRELDSGRRGYNLVDVEALRLFDRRL